VGDEKLVECFIIRNIDSIQILRRQPQLPVVEGGLLLFDEENPYLAVSGSGLAGTLHLASPSKYRHVYLYIFQCI
jgi:hypothetical protein